MRYNVLHCIRVRQHPSPPEIGAHLGKDVPTCRKRVTKVKSYVNKRFPSEVNRVLQRIIRNEPVLSKSFGKQKTIVVSLLARPHSRCVPMNVKALSKGDVRSEPTAFWGKL